MPSSLGVQDQLAPGIDDVRVPRVAELQRHDAVAKIIHVDQFLEFAPVGGNRNNPVPGFEIGHIEGLGAGAGFRRVLPVVLHIPHLAPLLFLDKGVPGKIDPQQGVVGVGIDNPFAAQAVNITGFPRWSD